MRFMKIPSCFLVLPILTLSLSGCGTSKPEGFPDLVRATITVTQEGQPLADAVITLTPSDGGKNWAIGGTTDSTGKLALRTYGTHDGAPLGKFKVAVTKEIHEGLEEYQAAMDREDQAAANKAVVKAFSVVEATYGSASTTPLEIEIVKGTTNYQVDVGKAVKEPREFVK